MKEGEAAGGGAVAASKGAGGCSPKEEKEIRVCVGFYGFFYFLFF